VVDERLLERVCKGDADAVSQLFARYQASIYRYAVHMCGRDAGDDIVQETFLTVMRQPGRYDPVRGPVIGYLFGIARHLALKRLTSSGAASLFEELAEDVETANPEAETALDSLTRTETVDAVRAAVRSLPPQYREVIVLCELQEMDYAAAAGIIQCPIGTRTGVLATDVVPASPRIDFLSLERCSCVRSVRLESDREHVRLTSLR